MNKILIPLIIGKNERYGAVKIEFFPRTYSNLIFDMKLVPILVSNFASKKDVSRLYQEADGVLLMGGSDIHPKLYKAKKHKNTIIQEGERDEMELFLVKKAMRDKKPIVGICRGCQMINVASGGTLIQHLPDKLNHKKHQLPEKMTYKDIHKNTHRIMIKRNSKFVKIIKKSTLMVNSAHHQAVASLGNCLVASGLSYDGTIEIIEKKNDHFCFGIQCHPEIKSNFFRTFFRSFSNAIIEFEKKRRINGVSKC